MPHRARHHIGRERAEYRIAVERRQRVLRAEQREGLALAQIQQASGLIDLAAAQHHCLDRAAAQRARMQRWRGGKLRAQVRRSVEQRPALAVA
jgi:hypothetical protein